MQASKSTLKRLMDNFISLSALQGINLLVPLITFPYLVRVLGVEQFGLFSFVMAVIGYGVIITDYGFDLSATKHISANIDNQAKIDEIFSSVIMIKSMMTVLFFIFVLLLILFVDKFTKDALLYFSAFGLVIGQVLFPVWFFQGIENMRYITLLNAVAKIIFAVSILIFVRSPGDLYLVFILNSLGAVIAGILAFYIAVKKFGVHFSLQTKERYLYYLKDAWYIFTSRVAVQLYQSINIIVLGFFVSNTVLGYYSIVVKVIRAASGILGVLPRAVYPYFVKLHKESVKSFYNRNIQFSIGLLFVMIPLSILVYYFSYEILSLVSGSEPSELMVRLLHIYAPLLAVSVYGGQFTNILVILNETKLLNAVVLTAGFVNLLLIYWVIHLFGAEGLTWLTMLIITFIIIIPKAYFIFYKFRKRDLARD